MIRFVAGSLIVAMIGSATYVSYMPPKGYPGSAQADRLEEPQRRDRPVVQVNASSKAAQSGFWPDATAPQMKQTGRLKSRIVNDIVNHCHEVGDDDIVHMASPEFERETIGRDGGKIASDGPTYYRCMNQAVMLCRTGINTICAKPQNNVPLTTLRDYCRSDPDSVLVPLSVTGHATTRAWRCQAGRPVELKIKSTALDARGFVKAKWTYYRDDSISPQQESRRAPDTSSQQTLNRVAALAGPDKVDIRPIRGECTGFDSAGQNLRQGCKPLVLNNHHENGRESFLFASQGNALSFVGHKRTVTYDGLMSTMTLDQVIVSDGTATQNLSARGICEYIRPTPGKTGVIDCNAEAEGRRYHANFRTDIVTDGPGSKKATTSRQTETQGKGFPAPMRGIWTVERKDCAVYQREGLAALKANPQALWIEVTGDTMKGADKGRFLRVQRRGIVEMTPPDGLDVPQEVALLGDGTLDVKIQGGRASLTYRRCQIL